MADILPVDAYDLAGQGATGPEKLRMGRVGVVVHGAQPIEFDAQVSLDLLHPTLANSCIGSSLPTSAAGLKITLKHQGAFHRRDKIAGMSDITMSQVKCMPASSPAPLLSWVSRNKQT
jgi:hypothetical protein